MVANRSSRFLFHQRPRVPAEALRLFLFPYLSVVAGGLLLSLTVSCSRKGETPKPDEAMAKLAKDIYPKLIALEDRERKADETVWAKEILAQRCGQTMEQLWDTINASTNKLAVVAGFSAGEVRLPSFAQSQELPHGIKIREATGVD